MYLAKPCNGKCEKLDVDEDRLVIGCLAVIKSAIEI